MFSSLVEIRQLGVARLKHEINICVYFFLSFISAEYAQSTIIMLGASSAWSNEVWLNCAFLQIQCCEAIFADIYPCKSLNCWPSWEYPAKTKLSNNSWTLRDRRKQPTYAKLGQGIKWWSRFRSWNPKCVKCWGGWIQKTSVENGYKIVAALTNCDVISSSGRPLATVIDNLPL